MLLKPSVFLCTALLQLILCPGLMAAPKATDTSSNECADKRTVARVLVFDGGSTKTKLSFFSVSLQNQNANEKVNGNNLRAKDLKLQTVKVITTIMALSSISDLSKLSQLRSELNDALKKAKDMTDLIPINCQANTRIMLLATAGLRAISASLANSILDEIKKVLGMSGFMADFANIKILPGFEEGLYAWLAGNFLQRTLDQGDPSKTNTFMDLGGGSTQIAFALDKDADFQSFEAKTGQPTMNMPILGDYYRLYTVSYLNAGREAARRLMTGKTDEGIDQTVCVKQGVQMNFDFNGEKATFVGSSVDDSARMFTCTSMAGSVLAKAGFRALDGVLPARPIFGVASYLYIVESLYYVATNCAQTPQPDPTKCEQKTYTLTVANLETMTKAVCQTPLEDNTLAQPKPLKRGFLCLDASYLLAVLKDGYKIDSTVSFTTTNTDAANNEISWALGVGIKHGYDSLKLLNHAPGLARHTSWLSLMTFCAICILLNC